MAAAHHLVDRPEGLEFRPCIHKETVQEFAVLPYSGTVETLHGTMAFRAGDRLLVGADGETLYVITPEAFDAAYRVSG